MFLASTKSKLTNAIKSVALAMSIVFLCLGLVGSFAIAQENTFRIKFNAILLEGGPQLKKGVEWRVFGTTLGENGKFPMLAESTDGTNSFKMSPGIYMVHASYGHASAIKKVEVIASNSEEIFNLNAGGLSLSAIAGQDVPIPKNLLRFDVYEQAVNDVGQRRLIASRAVPDTIIPFPAGTYHVVSQFGNLNAEVRADLRVRAGKVTNGELAHRAARLTLRLVRQGGGNALANTHWSVLNESGDLITESTSAFPNIVLSEGRYTAIARNATLIYSQDFTVRAGFNQDVEVIAQ
ncbi:MAG: hypothetical protein AB8B49_09850 [Nitratireductor sp.]